METQRSLSYLRAKKKVETLKGFYSHLGVYIIVNTLIVLSAANVFSGGKTDFYDWGNYVTPIFWGIGLASHAIYVFFEMKVNNNFLKRWEERKIKQFLEDQNNNQYNRK